MRCSVGQNTGIVASSRDVRNTRAECYESPRISSAKGASGPIAVAAQSHVFDDLLRSRAMAPASGIDPIETMTKSQYAISSYLRCRREIVARVRLMLPPSAKCEVSRLDG